MKRATVFDMDGLIIDSEPLWQQAELEIFGSLGVPIEAQDTIATRGLRIDEVVGLWFGRSPWNGPSLKETENVIIRRVIELIREKGELLPGALEALTTSQEDSTVALASSSPRSIIEVVVERFELRRFFAQISSGEDEVFGKPNPGIYLNTAKALAVPPTSCVAIEDSLNGVIAAKAARMQCIAVPNPDARNDARFCLADLVLPSLTLFTRETLKSL